MSSSASRTTIEIFLPDDEFDLYCKILSKQQEQTKRRNTEPTLPTMASSARSGKSSYSQRSRTDAGPEANDIPRSSTSYSRTSRRDSGPEANDLARSSTSRSRTSGGNSRTARRSSVDEGYYTGGSQYAPSNITGYRKRLDVPGMPDERYFADGRSKFDRRPEYVGQAPSEARRSKSGRSTTSRSKSYAAGMQLVPYNGGGRAIKEEQEDDGDDCTVLPSDSISQVSSRESARSRPSMPSAMPYVPRYPPPPTYQRSYSNSYIERPQMYGGQRGCYECASYMYQTVERLPRGYSYNC
jgi:hypothetical protein